MHIYTALVPQTGRIFELNIGKIQQNKFKICAVQSTVKISESETKKTEVTKVMLVSSCSIYFSINLTYQWAHFSVNAVK